ncbi:putative multidrug resistance protein fnx1 [Xylaria acuta]|nr:putative multidrug resistance protein fnx1 [Xylaria acuta]
MPSTSDSESPAGEKRSNDTGHEPGNDPLSRSEPADKTIVYLKGLRFWLVAMVLAVILFLVSLDGTITSTSVVKITSDLNGFDEASWILSAYQLGLSASLVVLAKLSDIFGRKDVFIGSILGFVVFSGACAASQTLVQLVIFRAFQGLAGGGCMALTLILITEVVPPGQLGTFASKMNVALVLALVLGPVLGGAISSETTWRWIFLINIPTGIVAVALALLVMPKGFPHQRQADTNSQERESNATKLARIDVLGSILLVFAAVSFTACFQEADTRFAWDSAYVITLLLLSVVLWCILLLWERRVTLKSMRCEPVLPWRFLTDRVRASALVCFMLVGVPSIVTNFQLPQRFQLVNGLSSIDAGVRILPFGAAFTIGSFASTQMATRLRTPAIWLVVSGSVLQTVGYVLLSMLKPSPQINPAIYGYQVICGFGVGLNYMTLYLLVPITAAKQDKASGLGLASQLRTMGTAFGLAISTSVFNGYALSRLTELGVSTNLIAISSEQALLSPAIQEGIRNILSEAYNRQMLVLVAFAGAQTPVVLFMWKREQIVAF